MLMVLIMIGKIQKTISSYSVGNKDKISVTTRVSDIDVLIDPKNNHGAGGILEKDLNLSLAKLLSEKLNEKEYFKLNLT